MLGPSPLDPEGFPEIYGAIILRILSECLPEWDSRERTTEREPYQASHNSVVCADRTLSASRLFHGLNFIA